MEKLQKYLLGYKDLYHLARPLPRPTDALWLLRGEYV